MLGNRLPTYAAFSTFIASGTMLSGKYFVDADETMNGVPSEYLVDSTKKISLINEMTLYNSELF